MSTSNKLLIKPISLKLVGVYEYDTTSNVCMLCKNPLTFDCVECEQKDSNERCDKSTGSCGHSYHYHCISKSLQSSTDNCPICHTPFNFAIKKLDNPNWKKDLVRNSKKLKEKLMKTHDSY